MPNLPPVPDPAAAWMPWRPSDGFSWNLQLAAHLFRRAGFGATRAQLQESIASSPEACVDQLLTACEANNPDKRAFDQQMAAVATGLLSGGPEGLEPWWLYRMLFTPAQLEEKLTLFWHGHFATSAAKVASAQLMHAQNELLRQQALGAFEPFVLAISRDPAMLTYLDSTTNARLHPNENYARELMELFCLGIGNYTERDIQETARCFTGWEIRRKKFRFNKYQHDFGQKALFGQKGDYDGDDAVRIILAQDAAPRFVAEKLIRFFVSDTPIDERYVDPLADELRSSEFDIRSVVRRILTSRYFFSSASVARKIRSPVELAVGILRSLDATVGANHLAAALRPLGQRVFYPPNVKGWEGGKAWINATTFIGRVNLVARLLDEDHARFAGDSLEAYFANQFEDADAPHKLVDELTALLLATPPPAPVVGDLVKVASRYRSKPSEAAPTLLRAIATLPEFQLA